MRVTFSYEESLLAGTYREVDGIVVKCNRCNHEVEVFGTSEASVRRGAVMLREECPSGEENFYVHEDEPEPAKRAPPKCPKCGNTNIREFRTETDFVPKKGHKLKGFRCTRCKILVDINMRPIYENIPDSTGKDQGSVSVPLSGDKKPADPN